MSQRILLALLLICSGGSVFAGVVETQPYNPTGGVEMDANKVVIDGETYRGSGKYEVVIRHSQPLSAKSEIPFSIAAPKLVSADGSDWEVQASEVTFVANDCDEDMMPGQSLCYLYRLALQLGERPMQEQIGGDIHFKVVERTSPKEFTELSFSAVEHLEGIIIGSSVGNSDTRSLSGNGSEVSTSGGNSLASSAGGCGRIGSSSGESSAILLLLSLSALLLLLRRKRV